MTDAPCPTTPPPSPGAARRFAPLIAVLTVAAVVAGLVAAGQLERRNDVAQAPTVVTARDRELAAAFIAFALDPGDATIAQVPFSQASVRLGLADVLLRRHGVHELADPAAWAITLDAFRGRSGSFSALELVRGHLAGAQAVADPLDTFTVTVGAHPHCTAPPVLPPDSVAHLRRVALQPAPETLGGCQEWFAVDLYVDEHGFVRAVTLDRFQP